MEEADAGMCGVTTNCKVYRSKKKMPSLLSLRSRLALVGATPAMFGSSEFEVINGLDVNVHQKDKYAKDGVYLQDGYLIAVSATKNPMFIECIRVAGIFENPSRLEDFNNCCGCADDVEPCVSDETDYPVPAHILTDITQMVLADFLRTKPLEAARDVDNDSTAKGKAIGGR
jgi:hypothetical protein